MDITQQLQSLLGTGEEDRKNALNMGLLQAGLGILANNTDRRNPMPAIAKGGMMGIQGYQQALSQSQAEAIKKIQLAELLDKFKRKQEQEEALKNAPESVRQAVRLGVPIDKIWERQNPEAKWVDGLDANGRPVKGWATPQGFQQIGGAQAKPFEWKDVGSKLVATDPYTGLPVEGAAMPKSVTPDAIYSGGITMRGQNMTDARAREANAAPKFHDGSFVYPPTQSNPQGGSIKVPGFEKAGNPSEGERKSATLLKRLEGSLSQLNEVVSTNPSAAKPEAFGSLMGSVPLIGGPLGNVSTTADRQRVEAAQLDILDAALTLGTGAAYTKEQLEGYRKAYFPQMGDSADTIKDKQDRLNNVIEAARISAGRAAGGASGNVVDFSQLRK